MLAMPPPPCLPCHQVYDAMLEDEKENHILFTVADRMKALRQKMRTLGSPGQNASAHPSAWPHGVSEGMGAMPDGASTGGSGSCSRWETAGGG